MRLLEVRATERLTPHMLRVTLTGDDLDGFVSLGFDDHVKLFFPAPGQEVPALPTVGPDGLVFPEGQPRPTARDYTPRRYDPVARTLEIDFALHDSGPATDWARQAEPGRKLGVAGPRGSFILPTDFDWHLLIGDETALPAIARRLAELPPGAPVVVVAEVEGPADELPLETDAELTVHWVHRNGGEAGQAQGLSAAVQEARFPPGDFHAWIACESAVAKALRQMLIAERGANPKWIKAAGYWRHGASAVHERHED